MPLEVATAYVKLVPSTKEFGPAIEKQSGQAGNNGGVKFGKKFAAGMAVASVAAVGFAKVSIDKFQNATTETIRLRRYMGGTAEEASRLRFAAQESGVGFDVLSKSMLLFSKHSAAGDKTMKSLGVSFRDANGNMRPTKAVLADVADKFAKLPNGPQKSALAMKLFGKSGAALVPLLNKGSKGMAELGKESDKLGNTISEKDTKAVQANIIAKRKWHATIDGLQIALGRSLFPALSKVGTVMVSITGFVQRNSKVMKPLISILAGLAAGAFILVKATKAYTAVQAALNIVMSANPIGLVILAIAALVIGIVVAYKKSETFRKIVKGAFDAVSTAAKFLWTNVIRVYFKLIAALWLTVAGVLINGAAKAFGWVPGIGPKLRAAAAKFNDFKNAVNRALDGVKPVKTISIQTPGMQKALQDLATLRLRAQNIPRSVTIGIGNKVASQGLAGKRAGGGPVRAGSAYLVGEHRPEVFVPNQSGTILPSVPNGHSLVHVENMWTVDPKAGARELEDRFHKAAVAYGLAGV